MHENKIHIAVLTETWLNFLLSQEDHDELQYEIFQSPPDEHRGVALLVNKNIKNCFIKPIFPDLHKNHIQIHSVEILRNMHHRLGETKAKFIIIGFYNIPKQKNKC